MELFNFLGPLLAKIQDPAVLVPMLLCIFLGYLHIVWRREEREDRNAAYETIERNTEALGELRNLLSALTGKVL